MRMVRCTGYDPDGKVRFVNENPADSWFDESIGTPTHVGRTICDLLWIDAGTAWVPSVIDKVTLHREGGDITYERFEKPDVRFHA